MNRHGMRGPRRAPRLALVTLCAAAASGPFDMLGVFGANARAENAATVPSSQPQDRVDRVAVRFWSPETGGASHPRFITDRELAFEARLEALAESSASDAPAYQDRHVRAATERHVAEELLSTLMIQHGSDPRDLPRLTERARAALLERVGGEARFTAAMNAEGLDETEIAQFLHRQVRAAIYVDRSIVSILRPSEEELREVFRTDAHPYRGQKLDDVRDRFQRWLIGERLRQAESSFLQVARTRVKIVNVANGK